MTDNDILAAVKVLAESERGPHSRRLYRCLESRELARALRQNGPDWPYAELYTYTADDLAAMRLVGCLPGSETRLDREPIPEESLRRVHLVIFGAGSSAESLAVHAALVAHYPNAVRDPGLRTRISLVSGKMEDFLPFRQQYAGLLEHCWCREVRIPGDQPECVVEPPRYSAFRKDFTDIEWEFIEAEPTCPALRYKLTRWAEDPGRMLTLAFCRMDSERNLNDALALPEALRDIPVWIRCERDFIGAELMRDSGHPAFHPYWPEREVEAPAPDFALPGLYVHYAYSQMHEVGETLLPAFEMPSRDELETRWAGLPTPKRWSSIYSAFTVPAKLRSVGIPEERWDSLFSLTARDVALLSEVEHNRWCVEELILGYVPLNETQREELRKDPSLRTAFKARRCHPDLIAYSELGTDEAGRPVVRYDEAMIRSLPLLAYAYRTLQAERNV